MALTTKKKSSLRTNPYGIQEDQGWNGKFPLGLFVFMGDLDQNKEVKKLNVCVAVDDNMGMMFNRRRQSQDKLLRKHLIELVQGERLWINHYTARQFEDPLPDNIIVDDEFLKKAEDSDFCFVENLPLTEYQNKIKRIFLFRWNRSYPADIYLDISILQNEWKMISVSEFEGSSHKKITLEEWKHEDI